MGGGAHLAHRPDPEIALGSTHESAPARADRAGAAVAYVVAFGLASLAMAARVWGSALRPQRVHWRLESRLFREILRVGAVSSVGALQTVLTAVILTGFVARFGTAALAGYGIGVRLELLQVPIVFAIGQALVVMVGTNIGAGQGERAKRIAWTGTAAATLVCLVIGWSVAIYPALWIHIFSDDAAVIETGSLYMRIVAPLYPLFGAGMALYFASQGSGQMLKPVLAGTARLALVARRRRAGDAAGRPAGSALCRHRARPHRVRRADQLRGVQGALGARLINQPRNAISASNVASGASAINE